MNSVIELKGFSDSDWAGDPHSRKSQSSVHVEADGAPVYSFSRRQAIVATSSGVAEFYAAAAVAEDVFHLKQIFEFFDFVVHAFVSLDSSAARGMMKREGVSKVRSLEAKTLWVQQVVKRGLVGIRTVGTDDNSADLGTKILGHDRLVWLRRRCGIIVRGLESQKIGDEDPQEDHVARVSRAVGAHSGGVHGAAAGSSTGVLQALGMLLAAIASPVRAYSLVKTQSQDMVEHRVAIDDGIFLPFWLVEALVMVFIAGMIIGGLLVKTCWKGGARYKHVAAVRSKGIDKCSQSQVTYTRHRAQPRFHPLGEDSHGCFFG